jgi:hypothetical protein
VQAPSGPPIFLLSPRSTGPRFRWSPHVSVARNDHVSSRQARKVGPHRRLCPLLTNGHDADGSRPPPRRWRIHNGRSTFRRQPRCGRRPCPGHFPRRFDKRGSNGSDQPHSGRKLLDPAPGGERTAGRTWSLVIYGGRGRTRACRSVCPGLHLSTATLHQPGGYRLDRPGRPAGGRRIDPRVPPEHCVNYRVRAFPITNRSVQLERPPKNLARALSEIRHSEAASILVRPQELVSLESVVEISCSESGSWLGSRARFLNHRPGRLTGTPPELLGF